MHYRKGMENYKKISNELIMLSFLLLKQDFRVCFIEHFSNKVMALTEICKSTNIDLRSLRELQLKLLEPILLHLRKSDKSDEKCLLIQSVIYILNITHVCDIDVFYNLYLLLFSQIFQHEKSRHQISEELKLIVLKANSHLIKNTKLCVMEKVLKPESKEKYSIGIFASIKIAKDEKSIKLRLEALNFLLVASHFEPQACYGSSIYQSAGDLFMFYLPGIIAPLQEIILRDETQHHLITLKALTCWGHIICLVLNDLYYNEQPSESEILKNWINTYCKSDGKVMNKEIIDVHNSLKEEKRTKNWLTAAAVTLKPLILKITEIRKHSNEKCRLELNRVMIQFLDNCMWNLQSSLPAIMEVLVCSLVDENLEVSETAQEALSKLEKSYQKQTCKTFSSLVETNFNSIITKLPGIINCKDEKLLLSSLKSFSGYLKILGNVGKLQQLISLSSTLKKFFFPILMSFDLQLYSELLTQNYSNWDNDKNSKIWSKEWKRFKNFSDLSIKNELENICLVFGEYSELETIVDYLMDAYLKEYLYRKEILIILNKVILGTKEFKQHVINQLLNFYLDSSNLYLVLEVDNENCTSAIDLQSNIIKVALLMEGLRNLAIKLKNHFQQYLFRSLYHVVEFMGNKFFLISYEATRAAVAMSDACGWKGSVELLIKNNLDYLIYHSIIKLKRNSYGVLDVLSTLMKINGINTVPNVEDIINNALKANSLNFNSPLSISYLRLFHTFVVCIKNWLNIKDTALSYQSGDEFDIKRFINYLRRREEKLEVIADNEELSNDTVVNKNNQNSDCLPRHIRMTVAVSSHCLHFLASKDKNKKLIVLDILNDSVSILAEWEDELLPLAHKIWSPLVARFDQVTNPLIIRKSLALLTTLACHSKHFLRSRTLKNVFPTFEVFLSKEALESKFKVSSSEYFFTQKFKLQCELLEKLGTLIINLELFEKQIDAITQCVLPYLSIYQPKELQEKCSQLFMLLKTYDPYLVWFKLNHLLSNQEFKKNVEIILR